MKYVLSRHLLKCDVFYFKGSFKALAQAINTIEFPIRGQTYPA
jgi:hypothetical protein